MNEQTLHSQESGRGVRHFGSGFSGAALLARSRAAFIHLLISAALAGLLSASLIGLLYPSPYFHAAGGKSLLMVIVLVDIVVGPLLTFMVFDRRKRSLNRDLAVIAALQIAALVYGLYATAMSRPVYQTFVRDRFELLSAAEVDPEELQRAPAQFRVMPWTRPMIAAAQRPADPKEREMLMFSAQFGIDLRHMLRHYMPYESQRADVIAKSKPLADLARFNDHTVVTTALEPFGATREDLRYLPLAAKREDLTVLVHARTGDVVGVVRLKPW